MDKLCELDADNKENLYKYVDDNNNNNNDSELQNYMGRNMMLTSEVIDDS